MRHELYITHPVHCTCSLSLSLFPLPSRLSNWSRKTKEQKLSRHVFTRDLNSILVNKRDRLPFPPAHSQSHAPSRKTLIRSSLKRDRLPFSLGRLSHRQKSRGTKKITVYSAYVNVYTFLLSILFTYLVKRSTSWFTQVKGNGQAVRADSGTTKAKLYSPVEAKNDWNIAGCSSTVYKRTQHPHRVLRSGKLENNNRGSRSGNLRNWSRLRSLRQRNC